MGEKFRKVVLDFVQDAGIAARQLSLWAGLTDTAVRQWKAGRATPDPENFERMLGRIPDDWRFRFRAAWDEDRTEPHLWRELQTLRAKSGDAALTDAAAEAQAIAVELSEEERKAFAGLLATVRLSTWARAKKGLFAAADSALDLQRQLDAITAERKRAAHG